jgi:hypothetical protein
MPSTLHDKAAALAAKKHRIKGPLLIDSAEAHDTESGKPIHRFKVVAATHANGSALSLFLNECGEEAEGSDALWRLFDRHVLAVTDALHLPSPSSPTLTSWPSIPARLSMKPSR